MGSAGETQRHLSSTELLTREQMVDDVIQDVDLDFDFEVPDARNLLQSFVKRAIIKSALKQQYDRLARLPGLLSKRKESVKRSSEFMKDVLKVKTKKLQQKITAPPFLRLSDKITFTASVMFLCVTEAILLVHPQHMKYWYSLWIVPLMAWRYIDYHQSKYHYFMLDFCYFVQALLLVQMFIFTDNTSLFQVLFALSNGPLAVAIPLWRNSLVFHDVDKITSVFIHLFPPLVTFCMRWFPPGGDMSLVCLNAACTLSHWHAWGLTAAAHISWQTLYLIKTEYVDKQKLSGDKKYMYSARWLAEVKPHPFYMWFIKKGFKPNPIVFLAVVQYLVLLMSLVPVIIVFQSFTMHCLWLSVLFLCCVWNGANFYFDVFSVTYSKRLQRFISSEMAGSSKPASDSTKVSSAAAAAGDADETADAPGHALRTVVSAPNFGELRGDETADCDSASPVSESPAADQRAATHKNVKFFDADATDFRGVEADDLVRSALKVL
eukprot:TRINITY_DN7293_c0_g1_i1.p1 TRINITY_DN7293_c0_g1~~TRINITY_DN7293_c0_g1_i1.p1  ORF type:complete len:492 (-),score=145.12 TRINITY_DN7293_c0_g1_i1:340-1815(-)